MFIENKYLSKIRFVFVHFIKIDGITPELDDPIICYSYLHHPIYFLAKEKTPQNVDYKDFIRQLEFSPIFDRIINKAYSDNASIKIYQENY